MLRVEGISRRYGAQYVLQGVSFAIGRGEIVGLLGRNGAGKSTTMNILTGYLAPTEGSVTLEGVDMQDAPRAVKRRIGYLPEIPPLYGDLTVRESLRFASRIKGIAAKEREARLDAVMAAMGVSDHAGRLVKHLSKGYRQRVGLAQAMLGDPALVVLDEPSIGLDPVQLLEMQGVLRRLAEGRALLISSHILAEIADLCTRVIVLERGRVVRDCPMETLRSGDKSRLVLKTAPLEGLAARLAEIPGVLAVERGGTDAEGERLILACDPKTDPRAEVFRAFAALGHPLLEMRHEARPLAELLFREGGE